MKSQEPAYAAFVPMVNVFEGVYSTEIKKTAKPMPKDVAMWFTIALPKSMQYAYIP